MISAQLQAFLATATEWRSYLLAWFAAKERSTGLVETLGLWSGDDHKEIVVGGVTRLYYGAQGVFGLPNGVTYEAGLTVQMLDLDVTPLPDEVQLLLRGYEPRLAPVEFHEKVDDVNGSQQGIFRVHKGFVDEADLSTEGGWGAVTTNGRVTNASSAREGTQSLPNRCSDATYRLNEGDRLARYMAVGGVVPTPWGAEDIRGSGNSGSGGGVSKPKRSQRSAQEIMRWNSR